MYFNYFCQLLQTLVHPVHVCTSSSASSPLHSVHRQLLRPLPSWSSSSLSSLHPALDSQCRKSHILHIEMWSNLGMWSICNNGRLPRQKCIDVCMFRMRVSNLTEFDHYAKLYQLIRMFYHQYNVGHGGPLVDSAPTIRRVVGSNPALAAT